MVTQKNSQTKTQSKLPYADTLGKQYVSPAEAASWRKRLLQAGSLYFISFIQKHAVDVGDNT